MTSESVARFETVIASEAKQSIARHRELDCFVASLLAMTLPQFPKQDSASSRRDASEFLQKPSALEIRGRRECRARDAPAASRAIKNKAHEHSHHGHTGTTRHSPRNGFTAYFA